MDFLPVFLDLRGKTVLIDGGGTGAARRAERALAAGATVHVFDPAPTDEVARMQGQDGLTVYSRLPAEGDLACVGLVYGASDDDARDQALAGWSRKAGSMCNIADGPEL